MNRRAVLLSLLAAVVALVTAVLVPSGAMARPAVDVSAGAATSTHTSGAAPGATQVTDGEVTLSVDSISPEVISSDQDLTLTVTVANGTDQAVAAATLVVDIQSRTEVTVGALDSWLADQRDTRTVTVATQGVDGVAAGASAVFSVTVKAADLPFYDSDQWGPRGVEVTLTADDDALASHRTLVVWSDNATVAPTRITAVIPVTASAEELALITAPTDGSPPTPTDAEGSGTGEEETSSDRLASLRERVTDLLGLAREGVVLAVDPALLQALGVDVGTNAPPASSPSTDGAASTPATSPDSTGNPGTTGTDETAAVDPSAAATPSATPAPDGQDTDEPPSLTGLRAALQSALAAGDVITLPWRDADVAALAHLDQTVTITTAFETSAQATALAAARSDIAWPASQTLDSATLNALPQTTSLVIAPPGSMDVTQVLTYTPSGVTTVGSRTVLLPDTGLSRALGGTMTADDPDSESDATAATTALSDLDARQMLRARTAIITREMPNQARSIVVVLDRADAASLTADVVNQRLDALLDTSWTQGADLSGLTSDEVDDLTRSELPASVVESAELDRTDLDRATTTHATLRAVSTALTDAPSVLGQVDDLDLTVTSSAWRATPQARTDYLTYTASLPQLVTSALTAAPSSTINVINSEAHVPVRLVNDLDQEVTVLIHLEPSSTRLQATQDVTATVPAHGDAAVSVPVTAVGSGDVDVEVRILAPDGTTVVGAPSTVHMRVRADWETVGTTAVGAVLALMLLAGIIRTVRRGRRTAAVEAP